MVTTARKFLYQELKNTQVMASNPFVVYNLF
jgi:hypothetical protein